GGSYSATPANAGTHATLSGIRWTNDLAVSGDARFDARGAGAQARLTLRDGATGTLRAAWSTVGSNAVAVLHGTIGGRVLRASMPAP
ncbi:MAG TPA: hypothetical protein VN909_08215, partial [Candidatus Dormibacteraeota bacterium]|nr:hypothetical protein [Candidatus Dormibacteraeota bacterium]